MPSITVNLTADQASRFAAALEESFGFYEADDITPRSVTNADAKTYVISRIKKLVLLSEKRVASAAAEDAVTEIDPT